MTFASPAQAASPPSALIASGIQEAKPSGGPCSFRTASLTHQLTSPVIKARKIPRKLCRRSSVRRATLQLGSWTVTRCTTSLGSYRRYEVAPLYRRVPYFPTLAKRLPASSGYVAVLPLIKSIDKAASEPSSARHELGICAASMGADDAHVPAATSK